MKTFTELLERKIEGCDALGGLEREKAVYQSVLKDYKKQLILFGVVKSDSELLHTEVFNLANKLAINGFGNEARKMHQICNGM